MEESELREYKDLLEEAKEIKEALNLGSVDTVLLMMIHQQLDQVRYQTSD